jgi:hypothetical protein
MSRGTNRKHDGTPEPNRGMTRRSILATREKCGVLDGASPCQNVVMRRAPHGFCFRHFMQIVHPLVSELQTMSRDERKKFYAELRAKATLPQRESHWEYENPQGERELIKRARVRRELVAS